MRDKSIPIESNIVMIVTLSMTYEALIRNYANEKRSVVLSLKLSFK